MYKYSVHIMYTYNINIHIMSLYVHRYGALVKCV